MSAADEIREAVILLSALRGTSTPGAWGKYQDGILVGLLGEKGIEVVAAGEIRVADSLLIEVLHATIDAQLDILRATITEEHPDPLTGAARLNALALARAINGATS